MHLDGNADAMTRRAKFANRLHGRFGLPVRLVDERLSSVQLADSMLAETSYAPESASRRWIRSRPADSATISSIIGAGGITMRRYRIS